MAVDLMEGVDVFEVSEDTYFEHRAMLSSDDWKSRRLLISCIPRRNKAAGNTSQEHGAAGVHQMWCPAGLGVRQAFQANAEIQVEWQNLSIWAPESVILEATG